MTHGYGLETNVCQLYEALAELFEPGDQVFLFGFSRGAFTVRALAGLIWRYGIPSGTGKHLAAEIFKQAWPLFEDEFPDENGDQAKRASEFFEAHGQRKCPIHFLGLWDTVKSYGGLSPVMLPHLRHNPIVKTARHALALNERRAWFEVTTWGWLDSDREAAAASSRLSEAEIEAIQRQDTVEVWFSGCHADVGGGANRRRAIDPTAEIALRWMLGEADHAGLHLNRAGAQSLMVPRAREHPRPRESRNLFWKLIDLMQRRAITNAGRWPMTFIARRGASPRQPMHSIRDRTVWYHESVKDVSRFGTIPHGVALKARSTRRIPAPACE